MKFKVWLKALGKALDPSREEKYITTLRLRRFKKEFDYSMNILNSLKGYPNYVVTFYTHYLDNFKLEKTVNFDDPAWLKAHGKKFDSVYAAIMKQIGTLKHLVENEFPKNRVPIDFTKVPFVEVKDVFGTKFIGVIITWEAHNDVDINIYGKFYSHKTGSSVEINSFDKTHRIVPMSESDFKKFVDARKNHMKDKTTSELMNEISTLYKMWEEQITYLKLKEDI